MPTIAPEQIAKAAGALKAYLSGANKKTDKESLFEREEYIQLQFVLNKIPQKDTSVPIPVSIPNTIYGRDGAQVCLFTKDPQDEWEEFLEKNPVKNITRVVSVQKLRTDFKAYQHRRELLHAFDFFLADESIVTFLPNLLGSKFYDAKKQPPAIKIRDGTFRKTVAAARDCTYMFIPKGVNLSVKIAHSDFTKEQITENIIAALPSIVDKIPRKWENIQSIYLKTDTSAALPLFTALPTVNNYVKTLEEKQAEESTKEKAAKNEKFRIASQHNLSVPQYDKISKEAAEHNIPVSKYIKTLKKRGVLQKAAAIGGAKTDMEADVEEKEEKEDEEEVAPVKSKKTKAAPVKDDKVVKLDDAKPTKAAKVAKVEEPVKETKSKKRAAEEVEEPAAKKKVTAKGRK